MTYCYLSTLMIQILRAKHHSFYFFKSGLRIKGCIDILQKQARIELREKIKKTLKTSSLWY